MQNDALLKAIISQLSPEKAQALRTINTKAKAVIDKNVSNLPGREVQSIRLEYTPFTGRLDWNPPKISIISMHNLDEHEKEIPTSELGTHLYHLRPCEFRIEHASMWSLLNKEWCEKIHYLHVESVDAEDFHCLHEKLNCSSLFIDSEQFEMDLDLLINQMPAVKNFVIHCLWTNGGFSFDREGHRTSSRTLKMIENKSHESTGIDNLRIPNLRADAFSQEAIIHFLSRVNIASGYDSFDLSAHINFNFVRGTRQNFETALRDMFESKDWELTNIREIRPNPTTEFLIKTPNTHLSLWISVFTG